MYLLGYDIGSSSIKVALADMVSGEKIAVVQEPSSEMTIEAPHSGWAEQDPHTWWRHACAATKKLLEKTGVAPENIKAIGIAYQMHGLVALDRKGSVVRPSIIWCDGRAVNDGQEAFEQLGKEHCLSHYLNSPGNFTASKLSWVKKNEPHLYDHIDKIMLPGDFIAFKMTDSIKTTITGLSEGIFWDFKHKGLATSLLDHYDIDHDLIPEVTENFVEQGKLSEAGASQLGLSPGVPITYRAGDQPNNAMALNVLKPGEVAATGGTSGVVYAVVDRANYDPQSRVNSFAHVNHQQDGTRIGVLLCINGAGIQYGWVKKNIAFGDLSYPELEQKAQLIPVGSDGLVILPFGNGPERVLENKDIGAQIHALEFNRHSRSHLYRAALEGIAFAFVYGMEIMHSMGLEIQVMRVGNDNLFLSNIFSQTIANLTGVNIEMMDSTGAVGAALAAGVGIGAFDSISDAQARAKVVQIIKPESNVVSHRKAYKKWRMILEQSLEHHH